MKAPKGKVIVRELRDNVTTVTNSVTGYTKILRHRNANEYSQVHYAIHKLSYKGVQIAYL